MECDKFTLLNNNNKLQHYLQVKLCTQYLQQLTFENTVILYETVTIKWLPDPQI